MAAAAAAAVDADLVSSDFATFDGADGETEPAARSSGASENFLLDAMAVDRVVWRLLEGKESLKVLKAVALTGSRKPPENADAESPSVTV